MKLAVIFPGIGYHTDKPLLYYSKKTAKNLGYDIVEVSYGSALPDAKNSPDKRTAAFDIAFSKAEEQLKDIDFGKYEKVLFISKSLGTVVSAAYEEKYGTNAANVYYTPVAETFSHGQHKGIVFHGTNDRWMDTSFTEEKCREHSLPVYIIKNADHSLETGNVPEDISNIRFIMEKTAEYIKEQQ